MTVKKPELLAPAGSFMAAWYAFEAGADAVYIGLHRFSARGSAQNYSPLELAKLKALACARDKKIYVALNTVIREEEVNDLIDALALCERLNVDGVLLQDIGALAIAKDHFPRLAVHASTQMAVGNVAGVREAARLGIRRIVLPREMTFDEIRRLRSGFPDIELEVFIHGALCYSYSGLCLASHLLGSGSGNRGACAQPCRLSFTHEGKTAHFLSCRDLFTGADVHRLADIGVDSLKIEGRLKPASWVYHTVRLYRFILDHSSPEEETDYRELLEQSSFVFTRERTKGRLFGGTDENIITSNYERSVGYPVGRVERVSAGSFSFTTKVPIEVGDVLQIFLNRHEQKPYKLPVKKLERDGVSVLSAGRGDFVTVECGKAPELGREIAKVYARALELPGVRHDAFVPYRTALPLDIVFSPADRHGESMYIETDIGGQLFSRSYICSFTKTESRVDMVRRIRRAFADASDPLLKPEVREIRFADRTADTGLAIGSRQLKIIRDDFLDRVKETMAAREENRRSAIREAFRDQDQGTLPPPIESIRDFVSDRARLSPRIMPHAVIPFFTGGRITEDMLARTGHTVFIPLSPVTAVDERDYVLEIDRFIRTHPGLAVFLGINNLHHLHVVRELEIYENVFSFIDFFFYLANLHALRLIRNSVRRAAFGYFWIEGEKADRRTLEQKSGFPLFHTGGSFIPPSFIHRGDFALESLGYKKSETDGGNVFYFQYKEHQCKAVVNNGVTYIFMAHPIVSA